MSNAVAKRRKGGFHGLKYCRVFISLTVTSHGSLNHALGTICAYDEIYCKIRYAIGEFENRSLICSVCHPRYCALIGNGTIWHVHAKAVP